MAIGSPITPERPTRITVPRSEFPTPPPVSPTGAGTLVKKSALIDQSRNTIIRSAHPSPLSARNGFFGSKPFSRANDALVAADTGQPLARDLQLMLRQGDAEHVDELDATEHGDRPPGASCHGPTLLHR